MVKKLQVCCAVPQCLIVCVYLLHAMYEHPACFSSDHPSLVGCTLQTQDLLSNNYLSAVLIRRSPAVQL